MFKGSLVALVTPFHEDKVDVKRLRDLVEFHVQAGTHGIVAVGTTGEAGTLSLDEKILVIKTVLDQVRERIPVIAGTAANATKECIHLTQMAMNCGVHGALIMTPAYIKPTQQGLFQHYSQVAAEVAIPIILYNVPSRTACDLLPETVERLSHISNIIGIKEASDDKQRLPALLNLPNGSIDVFCGNDISAAEWMLAGAKGVISVTANVVPRAMAKLADLALDANHEACLALDDTLKDLNTQLFVESNPIPIKWAMSQLGLINNELRLPLTPLQTQYQQNVLKAMQRVQ